MMTDEELERETDKLYGPRKEVSSMTTKKKEETGIAKVAHQFPALATGQRIVTMLKETLSGESLSISDLDRITVPAGGGMAWGYSKDGEDRSERALTGIIIHHTPWRRFYSKPYGSTDQKLPPDCFSRDGITGDGIPGGTCAVCPLDKFNTADGGKGSGKACQERRLLFLLLPGEYLPRIVDVPTMSFQPSKKYLVSLPQQGTSHSRVLTKLGLMKTQNAGRIDYSQVTFTMAGRLEPETAERATTYGRQLRALMAGATAADVMTENTDEDVLEV